MEGHFFECRCRGDEHTIVFRYDEEDNELYLSFYLNTWDGIFKRIWTAIKYIFGYRSKYGDWDEWILRKEDAERFSMLMKRVEENERISISND